MGYSEQFAAFREKRGLTHEQLAALAGCHRNTVINVETGRPVRFATIRGLMAKMGYDGDSQEVQLLALSWLQATTGIEITFESAAALRKAFGTERGKSRAALDARLKKLGDADLDLLEFAAGHREVMEALKAIHALVNGPRLNKDSRLKRKR